MKTPEDEAFDDLAQKQGAWGGGFQAKRQMAADKVQDVREYLASKLHCWHRLTGEESDQLVALFEGQPAQEPVAWRRREVGGLWQYFGWEETGMTYQSVERWNKNGFECEAIYATPPQRTWVGLTGDELADLWYKESLDWMEFARAHEAELKEKNNGT
jgi:hypothetical protein